MHPRVLVYTVPGIPGVKHPVWRWLCAAPKGYFGERYFWEPAGRARGFRDLPSTEYNE